MRIDNETYYKNKEILKQYKNKCVICGEDSYCCLELHHIKDKLYHISAAVRKLPNRLFIKECEKCICVCSNCHKKLHNGDISYEED